ncbi:lipopolysaccharide biosynthesis protein [Brevundimonas sp.]|uniref:lipopolysaccharide biosynthesis protein n=1 Tax=Brevundimonas sp. TaxID=1871086 RepID=UPI002FC9E1FA
MKIRSNIIANYAGQIWSVLLGLVAAPIYISILGVESYGLIGFFTTLQVWFTLLDLGMLPTSVREMAKLSAGATTARHTRDLLRSFEFICLAIGSVIMIALGVAAGPLGASWFQAEALSAVEIASAVSLMGVILATRLGEGLYRSCLMGLQRQVWLNVVSIGIATVRTLGCIAALLWIDRSVQTFFLWQAGISIASLVIFGLSVHRTIPGDFRSGRFSFDALRAVGAVAAGLFGINVLAVLLTQTDKILLSKILPLDQYGYYMIASTVTGAMYMLTGPITQATFPVLVAESTEGREAAFALAFHNAAHLLTVFLAPVGLILILFPQSVLYFWTGDARLAEFTGPIVMLLAVGTLANTFMQVPYYAQVAHGWTSMALRINIVAVIFLVPAILVLTPRWGPVAAAGIWAVLNLSYLPLSIFIFRRILRGEQRRWYLNDIGKPFLAALAVLLLMRLLPVHSDSSRLVQGAHVVMAGGLAMAATLLTLGSVRAYLGRGLARFGFGAVVRKRED